MAGLMNLSSKWDGLSDHLIAQFYEVQRTGTDEWSPAGGPTVYAPLSEASMEMTLDWQSPFDNSSPENRAPALMAMLQSGQLQPVMDAVMGEQSGAAQSSNAYLSQYEGRTGITKLNSTQVFNGMPPVKIQCTALFRAWDNAVEEVENPVDQLFAWALPQSLSKDGSLIARGALTAGGDMSHVAALMPSLSPVKIAMIYKGRCYSPLVIESINYQIDSPVNSDGHFVRLPVSMTLCTLTALDKDDWANSRITSL